MKINTTEIIFCINWSSVLVFCYIALLLCLCMWRKADLEASGT